MRSLAWTLSVLFVTVGFSGCVLPDFLGEGAADPAAIVKKAALSIDSTAEDADELNDVLDVLFEYRHEGADAGASSLTADYLDEDGVERSRPLSDFTASDVLRAGDLVVIRNVNLTSGLVIRDASGVVQERQGLDRSWYKAGGYPLPVASSQPGVARYAAHASSQMDFSVEGFEPEDGYSVDSATGMWDARFDGTVEAASAILSTGPRLDFSLDSEGSFDAEADVVYTEDGETVNAGGRIDVAAEMDHALSLQFNNARELQSASAEGRVWADGSVAVWDADHPKSDPYEPEEIEHPIVDENYTESEDFDFDPSQVEEDVAAFLDRLWNAVIDVGDEYRYEFVVDEDDFYLRYEVVVQVVDREDRSVEAGTFDSFRVSQTTTFVVRPPGEDQSDYEITRFTYWIDADSALLVYAQGAVTRTFDQDDLAELIERFGGIEEGDAPSSLQWAVEAESTLELEEYSGDLSTSPWFAANAIGGPAGGVLAAAIFVLVSDIGGESYYEATPAISFQVDDGQDRLSVLAAGSDADWNRLSIQSSHGALHFELNGEANESSDAVWAADVWTPITYEPTPVAAGDFLDVCVEGLLPASEVVVSLRDDWANAVLMEATFVDVAGCGIA